MADEVTRLRETSGRLLERELFVCTASELAMLQTVGEPSSDTAFSGGPPQLAWHLEWPCGLTASLQFDQLSQRLTGHLDRPEVEHLFRHLDFEPEDLWLLEQEMPQRFTAQCDLPDRSFELWRQDAKGTKQRVGAGLTEGDALCWRDDLQHRGASGDEGGDGPAGQYWVQRAKPTAAGDDATSEVRQHLIDRLSRPRPGPPEP